MTELCFKCKKAVVAGCGYYYLGNCFHARCLHCSTCRGKLVGKPFLTCENNRIFCDEECTRNYILICDDPPNEPSPPSITVNYSCNEMYSGSPDEPLFIPTLRSSPVPVGASLRMCRTDSLSSDLSGTSHTSDNSYTHDANKKPKKRILKQPHEKKNDHHSKRVHWRLDEVVDSRFEGDDTSLDSSDTYARIPDIPGKRYNRGWNETDESWKVNSQWNGRSETMPEDSAPDIDLPLDENYLAEATVVPSSHHHQVQRLPDIPSHQLTISPSDDNSTPLLVDRMSQVQLQDTPTNLQAIPPQFIDSPIPSTPDSQSAAHLQNAAATLTSTPVVLRKKNGVTHANSMPPVLKIRDSMVNELDESVYDGKPNMFQFPDTNCNGSPGTAKKISGQLSPLPEDTASLPAVLKISETTQLVENSMKSDSEQIPSSNSCYVDKDMMGQNILVTSSPLTSSPLTQEQSPTASSNCGVSDNTKTLSSNTPTSSFTHTNSDSDLSAVKDFLGKTPNPLNLSSGSTSSLPGNFSSYMNQPKLQGNARMSSTLPCHSSPSNGRRHVSTSSLPAMANGKLSSLDDADDIDTPMGEFDTANAHKPQAPVVRYKRHHSYGPESFSPSSSRAKQKLEAIMKDIELEENHRNNNLNTRNNNGCGVCHQPVVFEATFMLDGIGYHPSCFVCITCGHSLRGKRICKAKNQLYCEEDFLYHGFRLTQRTCDHCNMPIISQDQVEAYTKVFHKQCFQCSECYSPLPSEQDSRLLEGRPVCVKCHLLVMYRQTAPPTIRRTAQPIQGCSEML